MSYPTADDVQRLAAAIEGLNSRLDRQSADAIALTERLDKMTRAAGALGGELARMRAGMQGKTSGVSGVKAAEWFNMFLRGLDQLARRS